MDYKVQTGQNVFTANHMVHVYARFIVLSSVVSNMKNFKMYSIMNVKLSSFYSMDT